MRLKLTHLGRIVGITVSLASCLTLIKTVEAVKKEDFKTCSQSGFCRRNRAYADDALAQPSFKSPYIILKDSVKLGDSKVYAEVKNTETDVLLTLDLFILQDNTARIRINEKNPIKPRYDDHAQFTIANQLIDSSVHKTSRAKDGVITILLDNTNKRKVIITSEPLRIEFIVDEKPIVSLNDRGFFNFEHLRTKESHKPKMVEKTNDEGAIELVEAESEKDLWEESFKTWTDPKPNGPESFGLDVSFHGFSHVYGIPEHSSSLSLKETKGGEGSYDEPYRLYNTDVFEYAADTPMSLYGAVPFMVAHQKDMSAGVFFMNPAETWIDIVKTKPEQKNTAQKAFSFGKKVEDTKSTQTHWMTEAGVLDLFVFLGPSTKDILRQYHAITGTPSMPQMFAIGYHQSRWNYINQRDVLEVDSQFDKHDIPYDVIWLDIEYTDEKKYFTWDIPKFPDAIKMEEELEHKGRKLVTIIDPHIKRDDNYHICQTAKDNGYFVQQPSGGDYEAWCWPGQSSWVDFSSPAAREWWKSEFGFDKFKGTRENVHIWNDMNEPSVFNGPEITMQKEMIHYGKWEHRVLHNLYSVLTHYSTAEGIKERTKVAQRPFVLSRGFYAGTQRYGPIWTGDNMVDWESLYYTNPMILSNSIAGISFSGADVPGFFGNPSPELLVRWYQAAVFQPFFRGHAHIDTKRREPYLLDEPYRSITRASLRERYALLPYWYTLFFEAHKTGVPMMRPMFMEFPEDEALFTTEDQFMLGSGMLVKPVTSEGTFAAEIYFPGDQPWYDTQTFEKIQHNGYKTVEAPIEKVPAYYRGGHIIPRRERARRSTSGMKLDPFTLVIALDNKGQAHGELYLDDGETYDFESGAYVRTQFIYNNGVLTSKNLHEDPSSDAATKYAASIKDVRIERIRLLGVEQPEHIHVVHPDATRTPVSFEYSVATGYLTIKDPKTLVSQGGWRIEIQ
ncbi:glucosidase II catalytic ROT2/GLS2 [Phycomyces blakesleeanus NRRL 1555(-)]|uniref:Glucosidase II subunit alpha n=2 Tax=Phycomyces blakesleeanus TaxID=4837 RepID=A0A162N4B0_PHYB8|nr:glucosidase II catalytic ROT2/GLS2 [Phycomyces blakesleeanus NRRL 1555(-)]OAD68408.1 glucosidase II catalytic ROT2/GLS2 [Phycomyces blakesleeanus NRRL 1555(-)]|eukprot:XP_018286448.1 glucosidase II catalytic ROT2/GLS2 [Phycomyces blakesleeanus NRRL 1555(-)]